MLFHIWDCIGMRVHVDLGPILGQCWSQWASLTAELVHLHNQPLRVDKFLRKMKESKYKMSISSSFNQIQFYTNDQNSVCLAMGWIEGKIGYELVVILLVSCNTCSNSSFISWCRDRHKTRLQTILYLEQIRYFQGDQNFTRLNLSLFMKPIFLRPALIKRESLETDTPNSATGTVSRK